MSIYTYKFKKMQRMKILRPMPMSKSKPIDAEFPVLNDFQENKNGIISFILSPSYA
jgi:hypothetical protein